MYHFSLSKERQSTYHKAVDEHFDISEEFIHRVLLCIKTEILGHLLVGHNHSFVHAFKNFTLFFGNTNKLVHFN